LPIVISVQFSYILKQTDKPLGVTPLEILPDLWHQKTVFGTVLACDRVTDGHTMTAYAALA